MTLIDTSIAIDGLQYGAPRAGSISVITLLELLRGVAEDKRPELKTSLEGYYPVLGLDNDTILEYCRVFESLRSKGEMIPEADMIIAATAISKGMELETDDEHFTRLLSYGLKLKEPG
ncbi:MAG TPA: type II toxin-antitoxin system VapC family toxin [Candidatus Krumholzibacteriaceae bacterium]|nr:type II toxin-antitoxin system VapC family toxin [Candidatus Krumholzibacteriaceae bacterium]